MKLNLRRQDELTKTAITFLIVCVFSVTSFSQPGDDKIPDDVVPPPLTELSSETKKRLDAEKSVKNRTKLAIKLLEGRYSSSLLFAQDGEFDEALSEVGRFKAIVIDTANLLGRNPTKKTLRSNKRFELALRKFIPRLEKLRREMPFSHNFHVRRLIRDVRKTRRDLIDAFFGDIVAADTYRTN